MKTTLQMLACLILVATLADAQSEYSSSLSDRVRINGEAGAALFDTEEDGLFPDNKFLVEEAKLFVEASIVDDIYVFVEINVLNREEPEEEFELGELYVDLEDVSKLWNQDRVLNVRLGRFDIPFG